MAVGSHKRRKSTRAYLSVFVDETRLQIPIIDQLSLLNRMLRIFIRMFALVFEWIEKNRGACLIHMPPESCPKAWEPYELLHLSIKIKLVFVDLLSFGENIKVWSNEKTNFVAKQIPLTGLASREGSYGFYFCYKIGQNANRTLHVFFANCILILFQKKLNDKISDLQNQLDQEVIGQVFAKFNFKITSTSFFSATNE